MRLSKKKKELLGILSILKEENMRVFMLMYSHKNSKEDIEIVVCNIPEKKGEWAIQQVRNTIQEYNSQPENIMPINEKKDYNSMIYDVIYQMTDNFWDMVDDVLKDDPRMYFYAPENTLSFEHDGMPGTAKWEGCYHQKKDPYYNYIITYDGKEFKGSQYFD